LPIVLSVAARIGQVSAPQHKSVPLLIKSADDQGGTFVGLASVFDNVDHHGDIVRRGAFAKSLSSGSPIPLLWEHKSDDPRNFVGDVVEATETDDGLAIKGRFDLGTEFGKSVLPKHQGPQCVRSEDRLRDPQLHQDRRRSRADRPGVDRGPPSSPMLHSARFGLT
jgi:hypothetical protein